METTSWECPCPTPPAPGWRSHACGAFTATSYCKGCWCNTRTTLGPHHAHTCALSIHTRTHLSEEAPLELGGQVVGIEVGPPHLVSQAEPYPELWSRCGWGVSGRGFQKQIWVRVEIGWTLQCSRQIGAIRIYEYLSQFFILLLTSLYWDLKGTLWI